LILFRLTIQVKRAAFSTDAFSAQFVSIGVDSRQTRSLSDLSDSRGFAELPREHSSVAAVTEEILRLTNIRMFNAKDGTKCFVSLSLPGDDQSLEEYEKQMCVDRGGESPPT
jgi:hypothetical protein